MRFDYNGQELSESEVARIAQEVLRHENPANLSPEEQNLVDDYRMLTPKQRKKLQAYIDRLMDERFFKD